MKKVVIFFIIVIVIALDSYAKYNLKYDLECFDIIINKDNEPPKFQVEYSNMNWTNQDVVVKIKFSEEVKKFDGFEYKNDVYVKKCSENEKGSFMVSDLAGNETLVEYQVDCIDKEPPKIVGIENNKQYYNCQYVDYIDSKSGIKSIEKEYFGDLLLGLEDINDNRVVLKVLRHPKNIKQYKYYKVENSNENCIITEKENIVFENITNYTSYYIIAVDSNDCIYKSNTIYPSTYNIENNKYSHYEDDKTFSKPGMYDIKIIDNAGNETFYNINIEL